MEQLIKEIKQEILTIWKISMNLEQKNNQNKAVETKAFAEGMFHVYKQLCKYINTKTK